MNAAALWKLIKQEVSGELAPELKEAQKTTNLYRAIVLVWVSVFLMPTTSLPFVYALAPDKIIPALWIVFAAIAGVLIVRALILRGVFNRHHQLALFLMSGCVHAPATTATMELTRASGGNFFYPFFMIYFSYVLFYVHDVKWFLATSGAVIGSYLVGIALRPGEIHFGSEEIQNLTYLFNLTGIAVVGSRVWARLFFDEKRSRLELARANEGLRELDQAKTSFFQNVSHEIRTPLTLILTPVEYLLQNHQSALSPRVAETLSSVRINALRLLEMVNALLDFARLEAGREKVTLSDFRLDELMSSCVGLFEETARKKRIELELRAGTGGASIRSDADKMEKIAVNLIGNALKFTPAGGRITVVTSFDGERFEIRVKDTGIGIAPEHHAKIFERFSQLDQGSRAHGSGIGLAMVRDYITLLGGRVRVESELGRGATFIVSHPARAGFVIPQLTSADESEEYPLERVEKAGPDRPFILLVDDNRSLITLLRSILEDEYNLILASDGQMALEYLAQNRVDLIISDVMMPGISGLELCRRIKTSPELRHIPVVLLTARGGSSSKVEGFEHGADDYLGKPFDPAELRARVRSLFEIRKLTSDLAHRSKELEAAMDKLVEEELKLVESEKLRTLGEIAAGMAHELHNYLNMVYNGAIPLRAGVLALAERLKGQDDDGSIAEIIELSGVIADAARTAAGVTGELRRFAHHGKESASPEHVDLHALLRSTVRLFGLAGPKLNIAFELSEDPIRVHCSPSRLTQVLTNLVKNGLEAAGPDGQVTIRTDIQDGAAIVYVEDSGPGVPASEQEALFLPFHTSKRPGQGLGLGLALSKKVIEELGGRIEYDASFDRGARFVVRIPLDPMHQTKSAQISRTEPPPHERPERDRPLPVSNSPDR